VIIFFIVKDVFIPNLGELSSYDWNVNYWYLFLSIITFLFMWFFKSFVWSKVLNKLNVDITFIESCKVKIYSLMMRYIPGKVWSLAKGSVMLKSGKVSYKKGFLAMVLDIFYDLYSAALIFLISLFFIPEIRNYANIWILVLIIASIVLLHPKVLSFIIRSGYKLIKKEVDYKFEIPFSSSLVFVFGYVISWFITSLGLLFMIKGITGVSWLFVFPLTGLFAIAWAIGFLSIITPSGIGIREGVFGVLLSVYYPLPVAMGLSFLSRIIFGLGEIILVSIIFLYSNIDVIKGYFSS